MARTPRRPARAAAVKRRHRPTPRPDAAADGSAPVSALLRRAADVSWRLVVVGVVVYTAFIVLGRFQLIAVAVFAALVITAVLRPATERLARRLPRVAAVLLVLVGSAVLLAGLLALVGNVTANEATTLGHEFQGGLARIERWLERAPFHLQPGTLTKLRGRLGSFISAHRAAIISTAVSSAGRVIELVTGAALAFFISVFFLYSGDRMWRWFRDQLPPKVRPAWDGAARAAWKTFAGYTRGIVIVAASNAILVGIALWALGVPLVLPLMLLEFFATFIPLVGSPVAMAVAAVVALAAKGPVTAIVVLLLIVVIGQIEGHLLHPLVMSWAVQLHPVAVAIAVLGGSIAAGVTGAVVAVPVVSVTWAVIGELRAQRLSDRQPPDGSSQNT